MIDYGGQKTDLAVRRAEWRLSRVYRQAAREIDEKMQAWQKGHEARDKKYRQMVKDGKLSKADYQAWMRGQVFQGNQWKARKEQIQQTLLNADRAASKIINEGKLGVFAENANYIGYGLEHDANINTGFMLYDEQTVARLIKSDPMMLPMLPPEKAVLKDKAYPYYNKLINGAITQGIIQGEGIPEIAKRIAQKTGESSYASAVRNARTAYTGAQNAGRIEGLHQAQRLGINVKKRWLATLDGRTRDSHRKLDGQVQEVDKPFNSELGKIRYPGDPTAAGGNVYNCRCTLTYVYPEYPSEMKRRDNTTGEVVGDMTYREWEGWKDTGELPERLKSIEHEEAHERYQFHATKSSSLTGIAENGLKPSAGHVGKGVYMADTEEDALEWTAETSTGGKMVLRVPEKFLEDGDYEKWAADETGYGIAESVFKGTIPLEYIQIKVNDNGDEDDWWSLAQYIKNSKRRYSMLSKKAQRKVDKIVQDEYVKRG